MFTILDERTGYSIDKFYRPNYHLPSFRYEIYLQ